MIYQHGVKTSVVVKSVDNGYIVEWERKDRDDDLEVSRFTKKLPTCGTQIFTSKKEAIKFVEAHLA